MVVVLHHIGRPRKMMIAQKETRTQLRMRISSAFSGGGSFWRTAASTAFEGASSPRIASTLTADSGERAGDDEAGIMNCCMHSSTEVQV
jgi:hypothetical protein